MAEPKPHAVVVPGPGLGHVNGCLLLAKALCSAGFSVTIACFELAYKTHAGKGRLTGLTHDPSLHLEILPDGLASDDPSFSNSFSNLFRVTPLMHQNLLHFLQQHPATCLIADSIMAWTQRVADLVGVPRVDYWTATTTAYLTILAIPNLCQKGYVGCHHGPMPLSWKSENPIVVDCVPGCASFPLDEVPLDFRYALMEKDPLLQRFTEAAELAQHAHCLLVHSIPDLEPEGFLALRAALHHNVLPIGPLLPQSDATTSATPATCKSVPLTWLDAHALASVIFVSFGSNFVHSEEEIVELAHGLEACGKPFLWVIRSDSAPAGTQLDTLLPPHFRDGTASQRGLIVPWVTQLDILAHPSVGGFLSHCGWNSTLESMWMGVPILACPKRAEQPINCRLICKEWGAGIELKTNNKGTISRHEITSGIRALLDETIGSQARAKARELSHALRKASREGGETHTSLLKFAAEMKERCLIQHAASTSSRRDSKQRTELHHAH